MEKDENNVSAAAAASLVGVMQFVAESQTEWTTDIGLLCTVLTMCSLGAAAEG